MTAFALNDTLDWSVSKRPLFFAGVDGQTVAYDQKVAIVRDDTDAPLGVVAPAYEPFQNASLKQLVAPMVEEGMLTVANTGSLNGGGKVFLQLQVNEEFRVVGETYRGMLTILNSHNGSTAVAIGPTMVRVICSNTYAAALTDLSERFRHSAGVTERVLSSTAVSTFVGDAMRVYSEKAEALAAARFTTDQFRASLEAVYRKPVKDLRDSFVEKMVRLFHSGVGTEGRTAYCAWNAYTEYSSHHAKKTAAGNKYYSEFGKGASVNEKALGVLLEMAA
jgi:phage/plasmid-like protein (TIGR03299 family)